MQIIYALKFSAWKSYNFLTNLIIEITSNWNFYLLTFLSIKFLFFEL